MDVELNTAGVPRREAGESFQGSWGHMQFTLRGDGGPFMLHSLYFSFGHIHLSNLRLIFVMHPDSNGFQRALALPLSWIRREQLELRNPFLGARHVQGVAVHAPSNALLHFSVEAMEHGEDESLFIALRDALNDPDRTATEIRRMRREADSTLVPSDLHIAFVDPLAPQFLVLATHMVNNGTSL